ncbi:MAG: hypothetical protein E6897_12115 [Cutibacterium avidum]|nr:hypothetical protein [Cutibacterium avidum]
MVTMREAPRSAPTARIDEQPTLGIGNLQSQTPRTQHLVTRKRLHWRVKEMTMLIHNPVLHAEVMDR